MPQQRSKPPSSPEAQGSRALEEAERPEAPEIDDECSTFAIHDLAALADGQLSDAGIQRLARHLPTCRTCMATLVALVEDSEPGEAPGTEKLAALLAATTSARKRTDVDDVDDDS